MVAHVFYWGLTKSHTAIFLCLISPWSQVQVLSPPQKISSSSFDEIFCIQTKAKQGLALPCINSTNDTLRFDDKKRLRHR